ncbi:hypothetical protein [Streptomyces buecherae]|uniref:Uncharacterized protein n=1 Tax=Streptomyces buecherae TaxID=2763006 RepID=A0A7H8NGN0_9ACTN|nr:hypothetical protein [Streptomyces buecherae]QKW53642.1 hypothetical protein HUT08_33455 [Streptomyces buecherae]
MDTQEASGQASRGATVREVVRAVIADVAPAELHVVDALSQFDDDTVVARLSSRGRGREPLGFGLEEAIYLATPVVWVALDECVRRVVGRAIDTRGPLGMRRVLSRVLRRRSAPLAVPALNVEQVAEVRRRIVELSAQHGLESERADMLADRVAAQLLLPENPHSPVAPNTPARPGSPASGGEGDGYDERPTPA